MNSKFLNVLRCPFCSSSFSITHGDPEKEHLDYAVLACACGRYPVVAGIPILRRGEIGSDGETHDAINHLIEAGRPLDALLAMAMPQTPSAYALAPEWLKRLPQVKGMGRIRRIVGRFGIQRWIEEARTFLAKDAAARTAGDHFEFFLRAGWDRDYYYYFMNRFGQPRHLAALSLMSVIESPNKAVLDFGCGPGLLTHHLSHRVGSQPIIGVDLEFWRIYMAKHYVAPNAWYVCCDGASLPFPDEMFSAVFSSDTLYVVSNKTMCSRELKRVVDRAGVIVAVGMQNRLVESPRYQTMPYYTYEQLFDPMLHRTLANSDVIERYVNKSGPDLSHSSDQRTLEKESWFSIVATNRKELLREYGTFSDWPHAEGRLTINPLYHVTAQKDGGVVYRRSFPSSWYQEEDGDCSRYEPESVTISPEILRDLAAGKRTPEMESLIAQCVILAIPERFQTSIT